MPHGDSKSWEIDVFTQASREQTRDIFAYSFRWHFLDNDQLCEAEVK